MIRSCLLSLCLLAAACAAPPPPVLPAADTAQAAEGSYVIGPGDMLGIFVYRAPDLTVDLPVRPDGMVSMPLVSDIQAAGRTPTQLARDLERRLAQYVRDPNVTIMVRSFVGPTSRQVRVIGEASEPQAIPYREGMTVLDVMVATRGVTRFAAGNRAQIIRREGGEAQVIPVRLFDLLRNGDVRQDIPVRPGDTFLIPQSWF
ncbi:XrtA/PEP-CTERM system exopolysaccharide export protein [Roseococcus sp. DSY-14]|uniref:XrtA/PEP-CTERM system exopolysaccharide export protein n=1 Tax=Roseococcus sp. DSY-14 TaxID=3369650 RepID=UPI00387A908F